MRSLLIILSFRNFVAVFYVWDRGRGRGVFFSIFFFFVSISVVLLPFCCVQFSVSVLHIRWKLVKKKKKEPTEATKAQKGHLKGHFFLNRTFPQRQQLLPLF